MNRKSSSLRLRTATSLSHRSVTLGDIRLGLWARFVGFMGLAIVAEKRKCLSTSGSQLTEHAGSIYRSASL